jgi:hypothetical protein
MLLLWLSFVDDNDNADNNADNGNDNDDHWGVVVIKKEWKRWQWCIAAATTDNDNNNDGARRRYEYTIRPFLNIFGDELILIHKNSKSAMLFYFMLSFFKFISSMIFGL